MTETWTVPGFTEVRELGRGSSGRVVAAIDDVTRTPVVIKYVSAQLLRDDTFHERFGREIRLLTNVEDPNLVQVIADVESPEGFAIVMEQVDGVSLREMLRGLGPLGPLAALVVLSHSLIGLAAAHQVGVLHRDYRPENVLVDTEGLCKLVDLGLAVPSGGGAGIIGHPSYAAPELWAGGPPSTASDIYAATAVFFECLTGRRPFRSGHSSQSRALAALSKAHREETIPVGAVPGPMREVLWLGMAKDPADRPASAADLLAALDDAAVSAYGPSWESQGRSRLVEIAALIASSPPPASTSASKSTSASASASTRQAASERSASAAPPPAPPFRLKPPEATGPAGPPGTGSAGPPGTAPPGSPAPRGGAPAGRRARGAEADELGPGPAYGSAPLSEQELAAPSGTGHNGGPRGGHHGGHHGGRHGAGAAEGRGRAGRVWQVAAALAGVVALAGVGFYVLGGEDEPRATTPSSQQSVPTPTAPAGPGTAPAGVPETATALAARINRAATVRPTASFVYRREPLGADGAAAKGTFKAVPRGLASYDLTAWNPAPKATHAKPVRVVLVGGMANVRLAAWRAVPATGAGGGRGDEARDYAVLAAEARWGTSISNIAALLNASTSLERTGLTYRGTAALPRLLRIPAIAPLYRALALPPGEEQVSFLIEVSKDFLPRRLQVTVTPKNKPAAARVLRMRYSGWGRTAAVETPRPTR